MPDDKSHTDLTPKTREILEKAKVVFAEKGFDGASMQDLARATGMSAGNFYRYFPSKNAIVEAITETKLAEIEAYFVEIIHAEDPRTAFRDCLRERFRNFDKDTDGAIWSEIEASAARRPELAEIAVRMRNRMTGYILRAFAHIAGISEIEARKRFVAHAAMVILLVKGTAVNACAMSHMDFEREAFEVLALHVIDHILNEITGAVPPLHDEIVRT